MKVVKIILCLLLLSIMLGQAFTPVSIGEFTYTTPLDAKPKATITDIPIIGESVVETPIVEVEETQDLTLLGQFKLTVYTPYCDNGIWGYQTATGVTSQHLVTCAVDPTVIPYGTELLIREGNNELKLQAVDCGSAVKGNHIDIFYDSTEDVAIGWLMNNFGDYAEVYIKEE